MGVYVAHIIYHIRRLNLLSSILFLASKYLWGFLPVLYDVAKLNYVMNVAYVQYTGPDLSLFQVKRVKLCMLQKKNLPRWIVLHLRVIY